jgi:UDP-glucose 4-epimerase
MEVIRMVENLSGRKVPYRIDARRKGDPASLIANPARILRDTGWSARIPSLEAIVGTALAWRTSHPNGYGL